MTSFEIETSLGYPISVTKFTANSDSDVVIFCSATGVLQGYYTKFATFLQENNFTVYTFDYGGIGTSKKQSLKKFDTSASNWATNDIESVLQYVKKKHLNTKINAMGHSIGGQLLGLVPSNHIINNVILAASQSGYWGLWSGFGKLQMWGNWHILLPSLAKAIGYLPSKKIMSMENLPKSMVLEWSAWARSKNYIFDYKDKTQLFYNNIKNNLTSYSVPNDRFAPKTAVDFLASKYENANVIRKHLSPKDYNVKDIGHFGFFKSKFKETLWQEFLIDLKK